MDDLLLSKSTEDKLSSYLKAPNLPLCLIGSEWMSKTKVARFVAAKILDIEPDKLDNYSHFVEISSIDSKKIGIEEIRKINVILSLRVPSKKEVSRVVLINDANLMTLEAQNAFLKMLEEPPEATQFLLTTSSAGSLLPTIISRVSQIRLAPMSKEKLINYFKGQGKDGEAIKTALYMSGGQPGLMELILSSDEHPLNQATNLAKDFLKSTTADRLSLIDKLSKDKTELNYFLYILKEMAKIGLKSDNQASAKQWKKILEASLSAETKIKSNAQVKLTLLNFVLNLS